MAIHEGNCKHCGKPFRLVRASTQSAPTYCSRACYRAAEWLPHATKQCAQCGKAFEVIGSIAHRSRFCSYACYWASGEPSANSPFKRKPKSSQRKRVYVGRVDGKPRYIQRSHWVWLQHHPDDPILPGQEIHHKDDNRLNDDIDNLEKLWKRDHEALHGERNKRGAAQTCPICGRDFYRPPSQHAETCSKSCASKLRWQRRREST